MRRASIHTYGDTLHTFISYRDYDGPFLPGFAPAEIGGDSAGLLIVALGLPAFHLWNRQRRGGPGGPAA